MTVAVYSTFYRFFQQVLRENVIIFHVNGSTIFSGKHCFWRKGRCLFSDKGMLVELERMAKDGQPLVENKEKKLSIYNHFGFEQSDMEQILKGFLHGFA